MPDHTNQDPPKPPHEQPPPSPGDADESPARAKHPTQNRALRIGTVTALVAVVVAVIAFSGGGSSAKPASNHPTTTAHAIDALLAGIPQNGSTLGSPTAPVTMQYFGDLECPTAREFTLSVLPSIVSHWVRSGKLRIEYRSLRTVSEPEIFATQQVAALAAGQQNKLWYYLENFYHEQGHEHTDYVTETYLSTLAQQVPGLRLALWADYRHDPQLAPQVTEDEQAAHAADLYSTPSLLIGRTGSTQLHSFNQFTALDPAAVNEAIRQALHEEPGSTPQVPPTVASVGSA